jgi:dTDP-4-dehydrorhamnose reductase
MKKILVTGSTGLLGSSLCPHLISCGYNVVTQSRVGRADYLFDLSDTMNSFRVLSEIQPDVIVNLIGLTSVEQCQEQPHAAYLANTKTVENLAQWIFDSKSKCHLIQISTDHVYDGLGPHIEENVTLTNNYAFSKYAGELAAARVSSSVLRTNFVGLSKAKNRESLTDWVYKSLSEARCVQVLNDVFFSPLSINTLVNQIALVIDKSPIGVFNVGSHKGMSKADFDFAFAKILNLNSSLMSRIDSKDATFLKAYRPKEMRMNSLKYERVLGVTLPCLLDEILFVANEYK